MSEEIRSRSDRRIGFCLPTRTVFGGPGPCVGALLRKDVVARMDAMVFVCDRFDGLTLCPDLDVAQEIKSLSRSAGREALAPADDHLDFVPIVRQTHELMCMSGINRRGFHRLPARI